MAVLYLAGCDKPQSEDPVLPPLKLSDYDVYLGWSSYFERYPEEFNRPIYVDIVSGNGGYYIVYPEEINHEVIKGGVVEVLPFSEDYVSVSVDESNNRIEIVRGPAYDSDVFIYGIFTVRDQKGAAVSITVSNGWPGVI